ncbi:O-succinylbenzoic acid--CoA ligase [Vibrio galatheae]|uniref:O-succinylbenzoic acid--CoA ligase n=1 Tax=Vibrio galatheae TaxID=579748 RepID=A0A0F4NKV5_9VIBR|nr:o-succinylbenzoate--CoA ligase [Vibrio galatheae]KJY83493.1 O-succinylbenzoic acid--CoA ligase [Vibrio galatheae]
MSGLSILRQWAQSSPSFYALHTPTNSYTWSQLEQLVGRVAHSLAEQGIRNGSLLTCVGKNSPEKVLIFLACRELGAICAITMPQTEVEFKQKLTTLYSHPNEAKVWLSDGTEHLSHYQNIDFNLSDSTFKPELGCYQHDALATIVFTSGSTGKPKAVAHTSRQHFASAEGLLERFQFKPGDTWLLSLPLYHVSGLAILFRWLFSGATLKVGLGDLADDIQGVTHASLVATQLKRLVDGQVNLSLTHVLLGGSHVALELSQQAEALGIETWLGYGMTEAASTVTAKRIDGQYSAGELLPKRELRLEGQSIYIAGETLAAGYFEQGKLLPLTEQGWFETKDLGEMVGRELKILGRSDNLFISGGENIHCEEIEQVLNAMPFIEQSIVVPIEDSEFGYRPVAVLVCDGAIDEQKIAQGLTHILTKMKWPIAYYSMPPELLQGGIKVSRQKVKKWLESQLS